MAPFRCVGRQNAVAHHSGFMKATVGLRIMAAIVTDVVLCTLFGPSVAIPVLAPLWFLIFAIYSLCLAMYGQTVAMNWFGMHIVYERTGAPIGFFGFLFFNFFFFILSFFEIFALLCTGRSITENLFGALVIVK